MKSVDWRGVILGGLCAGLVLNVSGVASAVALGLPETFARFGVAPSASTALLHAALRLGCHPGPPVSRASPADLGYLHGRRGGNGRARMGEDPMGAHGEER